VLALLVRDAHAVVGKYDLLDAGPHADPVAELRGDRLGQRAGAAEEVAHEAAAPVPDEMEVADAVSGCEVLRLAGRASQRRAQDRIHARRHPAEPIGERAIAVV